MDFNSLTKKKKEEEARTPTLHQIKTSEKTAAEISAGNQVLDSYGRQRPLSRLGPSLEKHRRYVLINEHNRLTFAVKTKEAKLKELLTAKSPQLDNEGMLQQRIRQLENNFDKMKMRITAAQNIQTSYTHIHEHLQQEVRGLSKVLKQRELEIAARQAEVDKASKQLRSAAAADSTQDRVVQVEYETMPRKRETCEPSAEENDPRRMETLLATLQSRLREQEEEEEEEEEGEGEAEEEETHSSSVKDHQCFDIYDASQSNMKLEEDMEALREALGCADVQDLLNKMMSQRATREQLLTELAKSEELLRQEAKILADLESKYAELKFGAKPATTRFDRMKEQMQARLNQEVECVQHLKAELEQSQGLLDTVEQGINNIYFRMSCVPVEGLPSVFTTDSMDKLRDIRARLPTLQQQASEKEPEINSLDQEKLYSLLEQLNTMEPRNNRSTTPIDTPQLSDDDDDDEEECSPSRKDIKRSSMKLIESIQSSKSSRKSARKRR